MDIIYILKDLIRTFKNKQPIQEFINNRFKSKQYKIIDLNHIEYCITKNGIKLPASLYSAELEQVFTDYDYSDLKSSDVVLDIGANIGIFSLTASKITKKVYSVEPLYTQELQELISLNNLKNITILPYALSNQKNVTIAYGGKINTVKGLTFSEIKKLCGEKIDFLKCDCEGGEWDISSEDLKGIHRIEMELHNTNGQDFQTYVTKLTDMGYKVKTNTVPISNKLLLIHAYQQGGKQ